MPFENTPTTVIETADLVTVDPGSVRPGDRIRIHGAGLSEFRNGDVMLQIRLIGGTEADLALLGTFGVDPSGELTSATATVPTETNAPTAAAAVPLPIRPGHWLIVPAENLDHVLGVVTIQQ